MSRTVSVVGLLVLLHQQPLHAQAGAAFAGFLNTWGVAVPSAVYAGGSWQRVVDADDFAARYRGLSRSLARESRDLWSLRLKSGAYQTIGAGPVILFHDTYFLEWGLLTDFADPVLRPTNRRPLAIGALVSSPHELVSVEELDVSSPIYADIASTLSASIADWSTGPGFEIAAAYLVRGSGSSRDWTYFRAERWAGGGAGCDTVEVVRGWIRAPGQAAELHLEERVESDCDRKGEEFLEPVSLLEIDNRVFVIAEAQGWEANVVDIVELSGKGPTRPLR